MSENKQINILRCTAPKIEIERVVAKSSQNNAGFIEKENGEVNSLGKYFEALRV